MRMVGELNPKKTIKKIFLGLLTATATLSHQKIEAAPERTMTEAFFMLGLPIHAGPEEIEKAFLFFQKQLLGTRSDPKGKMAEAWLDLDWAYKALMNSKEHFANNIEMRAYLFEEGQGDKLFHESLVIEEFLSARLRELKAGIYVDEGWVELTQRILSFESYLVQEIKTYSLESPQDLPQAKAFSLLGNFKMSLVRELFLRTLDADLALDALEKSGFVFTRTQMLTHAIEGYVSLKPLRAYADFLALEKKFRTLVGEGNANQELLRQAIGEFLNNSSRYLETLQTNLTQSQRRALEYFTHPPGVSSMRSVDWGDAMGARGAAWSCSSDLRVIIR